MSSTYHEVKPTYFTDINKFLQRGPFMTEEVTKLLQNGTSTMVVPIKMNLVDVIGFIRLEGRLTTQLIKDRLVPKGCNGKQRLS